MYYAKVLLLSRAYAESGNIEQELEFTIGTDCSFLGLIERTDQTIGFVCL